MPDKYRLTYFPIKARAEPARYLFAMAGVPYEDVRIQITEWDEVKPTTPFGSLPTLLINGKDELCNSLSIDRYLASQFGFNGRTSWEAAVIDYLTAAVDDTWTPVALTFFSGKYTDAEAIEKLKQEHIVKLGDMLEKQLEKNGSGWLVGDSVSLADVVVYSFCVDHAPKMLDQPKLFDSYKRLNAMFEKFAAIPRVREWMKISPVPRSFPDIMAERRAHMEKRMASMGIKK